MIGNTSPGIYGLLIVSISAAIVALIVAAHSIQLPDNGRVEVISTATISTDTGTDAVVSLPHRWNGLPECATRRIYSFSFSPKPKPNLTKPWAILIPTMEMTPGVIVNEEILGGKIDSNPKVSCDVNELPKLDRYFNRPVIYSIPPNILTTEENDFRIHIEAYDRYSGRLGKVYLGHQDDLQSIYNKLHHVRVSYLSHTALLSLVLGIFSAVLAWIRRDTIYFWFTAFSFSWGLFLLYMLILRIPVPPFAWHLFSIYIPGLLLASGTMLIFRFLHIKHPIWEKLIIYSVIAAPLVLVLLIYIEFSLFDSVVRFAWIGYLLTCSIYPMILIVRAILTEFDIERMGLGVCFVLFVILGLHDWLFLNAHVHLYDGLMFQYAAMPTLVALSILIVRRFVIAQIELEALNKELENRVEQKSVLIEEAYRVIKEQEVIESVTAERGRLMRDMHDGVGGNIIGAINRVKNQHPDDKELIGELNNALTDLRMIIDSMDHIDNDLNVLLGLLRNRINPLLDSTEITINWNVSKLPKVQDLGPERRLHILRILLEAVTNVVKHSHATNLTVEAELVGQAACPTICVRIIDDGIGMADNIRKGRGLTNMAYRAKQSNIPLTIDSDGSGTVVELSIPVDDQVIKAKQVR